MIDWDTLVLGPTMDLFAQPIVVNPVASQQNSTFSGTGFVTWNSASSAQLFAPGSQGQATLPVPLYWSTGVFKADPTSISMEDGSVVATTIYTLGVQLSAYAVPMVADDQLAIAGGMVFTIDRVHPDGQGGATLTLKRLS